MTAPEDGTVVDARGTRCPVPVVRLAAASRDLPPGTTVDLLADDEIAAVDVPAWAWMRGHTVERAVDEGAWTRYVVRLGTGAGATAARST